MGDKDSRDARDFLKRVERQFTQDVRKAERAGLIAEQVERMVKDAKKGVGPVHLGQPEQAFLNTWLTPALHAALREWGVVDPRKALLAESHAGLKDFVSGTPARPRPFPFEKQLILKPEMVYARWRGAADKAFVQPCPDFAVLEPYRIVFEGKYFRTGGLESAQKQLVGAIHEALFYLGVPRANDRGREWHYEHACLVIYDASPEQTMLLAWQGIEPLQGRFWADANLWVIVLGQQQKDGLNVAGYEAMFRALGFTGFESHKKLQHPALRITVYFNRDRSGAVSFAVYAKDRDCFKPALWKVVPARQKKDEAPRLQTVVPKPGREMEAFRDLLGK